jgi:hypothetical protein
MSFLDKLERALGRFAIPNLTLYLIIGQVFVYFTYRFGVVDIMKLPLVPILVLHGDWWRVFSFLLIPPSLAGDWTVVFLAFAWYMFYIMGGALESAWGAVRYNLFIFLGTAFTVLAAFLTPLNGATNAFLAGSVFLAFARLHPDFELAIFMILPVKVRWLALLTWIWYGYIFVMGGAAARWQIAAAVGNYLVFFGRDIYLTMRYRKRTMERRIERRAQEEAPRHVCYVCGKTDRSHPELDFRYCSKCAGDQCYCPDHIQNHAHVVAANETRPH